MRSAFALYFVSLAACSSGALDLPDEPSRQPGFPLNATSGSQVGRVMIASGSFPIDGELTELARVEASFASVQHAPSCSRSVVSGCVIEDCTSTGTPALRDQGAGRITIEAQRRLTIDPDANGGYTPLQDLHGALWSPGDRVTVQVAGDVAPGFATTLLAPSNIELILPPLSASGVEIHRNHDVKLTWRGGTIGTVAFRLRSDADDGGHTLLCQFPARAGGGSVSANALALMPSGPAQLVIAPFESVAPVDGNDQIQVFTVGSALQRGQDMSQRNTTLN